MARSTVKSAERALEVLLFLGAVPTPVPAAAIAREVGLPKSSMYHLLNVMLDRGFVSHYSEEGAWGLGPAACQIGSGLPRHGVLIRMARPLLRRLASTTGASSLLGVLYGGDVVLLERAEPDGQRDPRGPRVGERFPAHASALGRALLMEQPAGTVEALFPFPVLPLVSPSAPRGRGELLQLLARSRGRGFATERGELFAGMGALAAPVFDHLGFVTCAVGVAYRAGPEHSSRLAPIADSVRRAAAGLSIRLGFRERESAS